MIIPTSERIYCRRVNSFAAKVISKHNTIWTTRQLRLQLLLGVKELRRQVVDIIC